MGKVFVILTENNEEWLRNNIHKKGDISKIINLALDFTRKYSNIDTKLTLQDLARNLEKKRKKEK